MSTSGATLALRMVPGARGPRGPDSRNFTRAPAGPCRGRRARYTLRAMKPWLKIALLVLLAVAAGRLLASRERPSVAAGATAPALSLPDLDGRTVDLGSLRGRVVAVNFWASWCAPCQAEIPELTQVWRSHRDRCFELLGVAEDSGAREDVALAARKLGVPYPVLLDLDGRAGERYRVEGYPRTYVIDAEGRVRGVFDGAIRGRTLEEAIRPLLPRAGSCPPA